LRSLIEINLIFHNMNWRRPCSICIYYFT